ncbi:hypothetical protein CEXT_522611 [Caerostris extrusa]|uniref:Uncharacterized protein n=1 Tax=Caerostris extrusa TaxID=172846 RepID=A0AAV4MN24_CAEEX|nr:hypothetical protein CEXT_522611 [Caerostris extrusa]
MHRGATNVVGRKGSAVKMWLLQEINGGTRLASSNMNRPKITNRSYGGNTALSGDMQKGARWQQDTIAHRLKEMGLTMSLPRVLLQYGLNRLLPFSVKTEAFFERLRHPINQYTKRHHPPSVFLSRTPKNKTSRDPPQEARQHHSLSFADDCHQENGRPACHEMRLKQKNKFVLSPRDSKPFEWKMFSLCKTDDRRMIWLIIIIVS